MHRGSPPDLYPRLRRFRAGFFVAPATLAVLAVAVFLMFPAQAGTTTFSNCSGPPCSGGYCSGAISCTTSTSPGQPGSAQAAAALGVGAVISGIVAVVGFLRLAPRFPLPPGLTPNSPPRLD